MKRILSYLDDQSPELFIIIRMKIGKAQVLSLLGRLETVTRYADSYNMFDSRYGLRFYEVLYTIRKYMVAVPANIDYYSKYYPDLADDLKVFLTHPFLDSMINSYDKLFDIIANNIGSYEDLVKFHKQNVHYNWTNYFINQARYYRNQRNAQIYAEKISKQLYHFTALVTPLMKPSHDVYSKVLDIIKKHANYTWALKDKIFDLKFDTTEYDSQASQIDINNLQYMDMDNVLIESNY